MTVGGLFLAAVALATLSPATGAAPAGPSAPLELVSRFTTYYPPGQPRVINIRRAAVLLDGTLVAPGARFSLNERLGKRRTPQAPIGRSAHSSGLDDPRLVQVSCS